MIPPFDENGNIPVGVWETTWDEFEGHYSHTAKRRFLLKHLRRVITILRQANCSRIYIDGSFITDKEHVIGEPPGDFDCLWDTKDVVSERLPSIFTNRPDLDWPRSKQHDQYKGDILPATPTLLRDFQRKNGIPKGILFIEIGEMQ